MNSTTKRSIWSLLAFSFVLFGVQLSFSEAKEEQQEQQNVEETVEVIVEAGPNVSPTQITSSVKKANIHHRYDRVLNGFSVSLPTRKLSTLYDNKKLKVVHRNKLFEVKKSKEKDGGDNSSEGEKNRDGKKSFGTPALKRMNAKTSKTLDGFDDYPRDEVYVAVLDTGISKKARGVNRFVEKRVSLVSEGNQDGKDEKGKDGKNEDNKDRKKGDQKKDDDKKGKENNENGKKKDGESAVARNQNNDRELGTSEAQQSSHGTSVAATIAGFNRTEKQLGVAPNIRLLDVKIANKKGEAKLDDVIKGIEWVLDWREKNNRRRKKQKDNKSKNINKRVFFESGKATLSKKQKQKVWNLATDVLKEDSTIRIEGHTDTDPIKKELENGASNNYELARMRVNNIRKTLTENFDISEDRIETKSFGPCRPEVPNNIEAPEKHKQLNRRAEITVQREPEQVKDLPLHVLNFSFTSRSLKQPKQFSALLKAFQKSVLKGLLPVVPSGNAAKKESRAKVDRNGDVVIPAYYSESITVGAIDHDSDTLADFSNYGKRLDLMAPGSNIKTLMENGEIQKRSGTSFATGYVSGAAALLVASSLQEDEDDGKNGKSGKNLSEQGAKEGDRNREDKEKKEKGKDKEKKEKSCLDLVDKELKNKKGKKNEGTLPGSDKPNEIDRYSYQWSTLVKSELIRQSFQDQVPDSGWAESNKIKSDNQPLVNANPSLDSSLDGDQLKHMLTTDLITKDSNKQESGEGNDGQKGGSGGDKGGNKKPPEAPEKGKSGGGGGGFPTSMLMLFALVLGALMLL